MPLTTDRQIEAILGESAEFIDNALAQRLAVRQQAVSPRLLEAMRYSTEAGGKRLRPTLVLWCCELCGGGRDEALPAALAVECVHTFSLIHDDLPAIDDDALRRGRASNHVVFGEAQAILAGDALLGLAFEILANDVREPLLAVAMIRELAAAIGAAGLIGGESADLEGERQPPNIKLVEQIHAAKTARLIEACCRLGALAAGAPDNHVEALAAYGHYLGLAFQAADDLLDVHGNADSVGKRTGKDSAAGKQTYVRAVGVEEARRIALAAADRAVAALAPFGTGAARLAALSGFVVERRS